MLFSFLDLDARTRLHIIQFTSRQLAIILILGDAEINVAVRRGVGESFFDQTLDHGLDSVHRLRGARVDGGGQDVQVFQVLSVIVNVSLREFERIFLELVGAVDDLVVHVGVVHHVFDFVAAIFQITADDVKHQSRHGMTDMRVVVDCHAADIHPDGIRLDGLEIFFLASESIIDTKHDFFSHQGYQRTRRKIFSLCVSLYPWWLIYPWLNFLRLPFSSSTRAKIIRPAAVCNTFVTCTSIYSPI